MPDIFGFFSRLDANNNREWFNAHKDEYLALRQAWIADIQRIIGALADEWPEIRYLEARRCTYRIYRDIRFSPDKAPYKRHIASSIVPPGPRHLAGLYFQAGISDADNGLYAGIWQPEAADLKKLRRAIDSNAEEWLDIVNDPVLQAELPHWVGSAVKTAPKGYDRNHPLIKYLRYKDIGLQGDITRAEFSDGTWVDTAIRKSRAALPLVRFLNYSLTEDI